MTPRCAPAGASLSRVMHPSQMQNVFAPPMPFHPEELYKHVKELERAYALLPATDTNARTAVAKAIAVAVGAFVERSLFQQGDLHRPVPAGWAKAQRGLVDMWKCLTATFPAPPSKEDEGAFERLKTLRNDVSHGNIVNQERLLLERVASHREEAVQILHGVYTAVGSRHPAWW